MRCLLLDGSPAGDDACRQGVDALRRAFAEAGHSLEVVTLAGLAIAPCRACFGCWTISPGRCVIADGAEDAARRIMASEVVAIFAPVPFGVFHSQAKKLLDRLICLVSPRFEKTSGLTRHKPRYRRYPAMLGVGWLDAPDALASKLFARLVEHSCYTLRAKAWGHLVLDASMPWPGMRQACLTAVDRLTRPEAPAPCPGAGGVAAGEDADPGPPGQTKGGNAAGSLARPCGTKALVLTGSPRKMGASGVLGQELLERLAQRGWEAQRVHLAGFLEGQEERARLLGAFLEAQLVVLATPVFVDAPPGVVMRALEFLAGAGESAAAGVYGVAGGPDAAACRERPLAARRRLAVLCVCGLPEASHTAITLEACRLFSRQAGLEWAGGLGVGASGVIAGRGLPPGKGPAAHIRQALDLAGECLARGEDIPARARELAAKPMIPKFLSLWMAEAGFLAQARRHEVLFKMGATPYQKP